jgi:hypothetical protein
MLGLLSDVPDGVQAIQAVGTVTASDYERVFAPLVERARTAGRRLRLLYEFGPEFQRITPAALWADTRLGLGYLRLLDGCAVVSDIDWIRQPTLGIGAWMPCPVRVYGVAERGPALGWLTSLPRGRPARAGDLATAYIGGMVSGLAALGTVGVSRIAKSGTGR